MKRRATWVAALAVAVGILIAAPPASAASTTCNGVLAGTTVTNLVVPAGASCTLVGVTVEGNARVEAGATLVAIDTSFERNLATNGAFLVELLGVSVANNGSIVGTTDGVLFVGFSFGRNLSLLDNMNGVLLISGTIGKNLCCFGNVPAPFLIGTTVGNNASGQCAAV